MKHIVKRIMRRFRADLALLLETPRAHLDAEANANYWSVRRAHMSSAANEFQRERARWIAERIADSEGALLDVGSGTGEMLLLMRRQGLEILASDFSPISQTRLRQLGFRVVDIDVSKAESINALTEVDYVTVCEVLEHLQNPEVALTRLRQKARRAVYFSVPNTGYYIYRLRLLFGRFPIQWRAHPGEHVRYWTLADMRWWLAQLGLSAVASIRPYQGWPILRSIWPGAFAMGLLVEVRTDVTREPLPQERLPESSRGATTCQTRAAGESA